MYDVTLLLFWVMFHFGFVTWLQQHRKGYTYTNHPIGYILYYVVFAIAPVWWWFDLPGFSYLYHQWGIVMAGCAAFVYVFAHNRPDGRLYDLAAPRRGAPGRLSHLAKVSEIAFQSSVVLALALTLLSLTDNLQQASIWFAGIVAYSHLPAFFLYRFPLALAFFVLSTSFACAAPWVVTEVVFGVYALFSFHVLIYLLIDKVMGGYSGHKK